MSSGTGVSLWRAKQGANSLFEGQVAARRGGVGGRADRWVLQVLLGSAGIRGGWRPGEGGGVVKLWYSVCLQQPNILLIGFLRTAALFSHFLLGGC